MGMINQERNCTPDEGGLSDSLVVVDDVSIFIHLK